MAYFERRELDYGTCRDLLAPARTSRKLMHNTYLHRLEGGEGQADVYGVLFHRTYILKYWPDGSVIIDIREGNRDQDGGYYGNPRVWRTPTTKARLNAFLPPGFWISQNRRVWSIVIPVGWTYQRLFIAAPWPLELPENRVIELDIVARLYPSPGWKPLEQRRSAHLQGVSS